SRRRLVAWAASGALRCAGGVGRSQPAVPRRVRAAAASGSGGGRADCACAVAPCQRHHAAARALAVVANRSIVHRVRRCTMQKSVTRLACARRIWLAAMICVLAGPAAPVTAQEPLKIRLGTLAPKGSMYHRALQEMGEKWRQAQGAGSTFTVYTDGTQGG